MLYLLLALSPPGDLDDRELARRIRAGDRGAFRVFFERYHGLLFGYLRRRNVSPDVCEDLIQNAFVTIWERRRQIEPGKSLRAFVFRIGYTRALNHFRDHAKFADAAALTERPSDGASPEQEARHVLMQETLRDAVALLPERRRAVFELCFFDELTYREAAEVLDISVKTVENQMGHALKTVRRAMADFME